MPKGIGVKADGEKRKWGGYPKMGLTPDEATTLIQRLEVGKSLGQLTRCASNPDYLVPVPRYLVHRKNQPDFRAKVDAITGFVCRSKALEHWRGGSPGLSPDMASTIMLGLRSGQLTIRHYTSSTKEEHYLCSNVRFRKHCELNPEWGVEARRLSNATVNRRKSENHPLRKATVCRAGLHEMTGDNVRIRSRGTRVCRACEAAASKRVPTPMTETEKERFKAVLTSGQPVTLQFLIQGKPVGGGLKRVKPLVMVKDFYHACRTDPDFARFVKENRPNTLSIGQRARRARELSIANRAKTDQDAKDYFSIQAMIPRWFPEQDKFDVVNDVMAELVAGVITRDELQGRVRFYMKQAGQMFAPKHPKFGNSPLVSLDEMLFEDGSTTRGDTVSRGLWD
jgi:hypothetical protein